MILITQSGRVLCKIGIGNLFELEQFIQLFDDEQYEGGGEWGREGLDRGGEGIRTC